MTVKYAFGFSLCARSQKSQKFSFGLFLNVATQNQLLFEKWSWSDNWGGWAGAYDGNSFRELCFTEFTDAFFVELVGRHKCATGVSRSFSSVSNLRRR
jgi:hypothetical protein